MRSYGRGRLRKTSAGWQGDWKDAQGKRHRQVLSKAKEDAERILSRLVRERDLLRGGVNEGLGLDLSIAEALELYEADLETRATLKSKQLRKAAVHRVRASLKAHRVGDLMPVGIQEFVQRRLKAGASRATVNEDVLAVRAMLNHAVRLGKLASSPLASVRLLPVSDRFRRRKARALTDSECRRLLKACRLLDQKLKVPQEPFVLALLTTGARWGELAALSWDDVDLKARRMTLKSTKNGNPRSLFLDDLLAERLTCLYGTRMRGDEVFRAPKGKRWTSISNFRRYLNEALRLAKVKREGAHIHALRHTFATRLARAGVPLQQAQYLTGHKTARMLTDIYTHLGSEDTRDAVKNLPRLA